MPGQALIDTEALKIAVEARTEARTAKEEGRLLRSELTGSVNALHTKLDLHRAEARADIGGVYKLSWAAVGGLILILLGVIGFLFVALYGNGHGDIKRVVTVIQDHIAVAVAGPPR